MKRQWLRKGLVLGGLLGVTSLTLSAQPSGSALPGTVNYLEGQVSINGATVTTGDIGKAQVAASRQNRAERPIAAANAHTGSAGPASS
jgi:hypothetical protein